MSNGSGFPDYDDFVREVNAAKMADEIIKREKFRRAFCEKYRRIVKNNAEIVNIILITVSGLGYANPGIVAAQIAQRLTMLGIDNYCG